MRTVITSDFHLGDDRMKLLGRPYRTGDECANDILHQLCQSINDGDDLIVVGDLCMDEKWLTEFDAHTEHASRRVLIKGNYDTLPDETYRKVFDFVTDTYIDMDIEHEGAVVPCRIHHYPSKDSVPERFSLCGHIHGAWKVQKNMLNVGVDVHHFLPIDNERIHFYYNGICSFYDQDVWVAEHASNQGNKERGREGTYWETNFAGSHKS